MPEIGKRVVCGLGVVIATLEPTRVFKSVDFPTLERPIMVIRPDFIEVSNFRA